MPPSVLGEAARRLLSVLLWVSVAWLAACGSAGEEDSPAGLGELPRETYDPVLARELAVGTLGNEDPAASIEPLGRAVAMNDGLADGWLLLATAHAGLGEETAAVDALMQLSKLGIRPPIEAFESLGTLQDDPRLAEFAERLRSHLEPAGSSETVFTLPERDLVTEGIAFDPESRAYYVSSVHRRKIVRRDADGSLRDLVSHEAGADVGGLFGLAFDPEGDRLWAVTSTIHQMRGFEEERDLESALLAVDPDSGEILERHELPKGHRLNDLVLADDGSVYVSDNQPPGALFRLPPGGDALEPIGPDVVLHSPQGLAIVEGPEGEEILLVADYSYGLVAIDLRSDEMGGDHWYVEPPSLTWMQTLDGLDRVGPGELVASQNGGYPPHRILRLGLSADRRSVESVEILAKALPEWDEPTLGTVVRGADGEPDRWVYVARSQWGRFGPEGEILPTDQLQDGLVMSVALD